MVAFPRQSVIWKLEEKTTLQRITLNLAWYGVAIGVVMRLYRWAVLAVIAPESLGAVLGTIGFGVILMCALVTGHLANRSLKSWPWRVPAIGALVALGESVTSLVLTLVHQERMGRDMATLPDWPGSAVSILLSRVVIVGVFGLVLSGVVVAVRKATDDRGGRSEE
jgi:hypothetical protein